MTAEPDRRPQIVVTPLLVDAPTAARILGIGHRTFERLVSTGRVPRPLRLGRRRLWRLQPDLAEWVSDGCNNQEGRA